MSEDNAAIVARADYLINERKGSVEQVWELIEKFVLPLRGEFYSDQKNEHEVDWHRRSIYDSTAVFACQALAASIHGNLTSPSQTWFEYTFKDAELNEDDEIKEWLDECTNLVYAALGESNFDIEIAEAYLELVAFGTAALTEELDENTGKLMFSAMPIKEVYFEEDYTKQVAKLYRVLRWTPMQIITKFGKDDVPERVLDLANTPSGSTERLDVVFTVYPRDDKADADIGKPLAPKMRPIGFKYILKDTKELLGEEGGYYEMPAFVARWRKTPGSRWGHSPATIALSDILMLNQVKEATMDAAAKAIDPANLAEESALIGDIDLARGGLTVVTDINGLKPYESGSRFDVSNLEIGMLTDSIRRAFYADQLELKESPQMTATEVNVRYELMQRLLGPTFGRLKTDLLDPIVERAFNILYREGRLPELPAGLSGADIDINYTGPLARSQKFEEATAIQNYMMVTAQLADAYPDALDIIDVDGSMRLMSTLQGVPAKALRGQAEIDKVREARKQQQEAAMQAQAAQEAGAAMESVGKGAQAMGEAPPEMMQAMGQAAEGQQ